MKKALIVDDTKNIRMLLTTCLEVMGYEVVTASNGQEALDLFEHNTFDLALIDIKMIKISGTEVLRKIRAKGIDTPVVIMTAFATVKNAVECTKLGAAAYLQKPFTAEKIKIILSEIENSNEIDSNLINLISKSKEMINNGDINEAFNILKKALSINPSYSECYTLIGKIYELKGDIEKAKKFYKASKCFD
ncbi:response regulator [Clostridium sp. MB40-C1]|uniref:response regulator n=1 Tax=Clostridium sp. MB40-C1 TaxID=3070996 RepID=UPI0027DF0904|nr:response regulator [Clostridium sp. MB40-C1]WMJ79372.1 response regulator [Clostridium sp. MB40-C1]